MARTTTTARTSATTIRAGSYVADRYGNVLGVVVRTFTRNGVAMAELDDDTEVAVADVRPSSGMCDND